MKKKLSLQKTFSKRKNYDIIYKNRNFFYFLTSFHLTLKDFSPAPSISICIENWERCGRHQNLDCGKVTPFQASEMEGCQEK
jgi:hypothetical protein